MKSYLYLIALCTILISCKDKVQVVATPPGYTPLDSLSQQKSDIKLYALSAQAQKDLADSDDFQHLHKKILNIAKANPFYIKRQLDSVSEALQNFESHLRPKQKIKPIESRILVLNTEIGLLQNLIDKRFPNSENILNNNGRLLIAYNSLIVQLNELSLAIPENIKNELLNDSQDLRELNN
ncbi:hypothetical protein [Aquimarina rhabdastrellae]